MGLDRNKYMNNRMTILVDGPEGRSAAHLSSNDNSPSSHKLEEWRAFAE
jgi:hypothetical protein